MLSDVKDVYAEIKLPIMLKIVQKPGLLPKYIENFQKLYQIRHWLKSLEEWDFIFDKDSVNATIYHLWDIFFIDSVFKKQIPDEVLRLKGTHTYESDTFYIKLLKNLQDDPTYFSKYCKTGNEDLSEACVRNLVKSLELTYDYLIPPGTSYNENDAKYGNLHKIEYNHMPFSSTPLKVLYHRTSQDSGSKNTINVGAVYLSDFEKKGLESSHTPNYRQIIDFGDIHSNFFSIETGASENPIGTSFYYNQHDYHMSLEMIPMYFDRLNDETIAKPYVLEFIANGEITKEEKEILEAEKDLKEVRQHL